jgi:hypothetical protein
MGLSYMERMCIPMCVSVSLTMHVQVYVSVSCLHEFFPQKCATLNPKLN